MTVATLAYLAVVAGMALLQGLLVAQVLFLVFPIVGAVLNRRDEKVRIKARRAGRTMLAEVPRVPDAPPPRIAVLIAARNEAAVIEACIAALRRQRFPATGYDVHVVADRCTDETADLARRAGATVHERADDGPATKGAALAWLWERLRDERYGAVAILDADNLADRDFLRQMAAALSKGQPVVQGLRRAKNADAGGVAALDALAEVLSLRVGAAGRARLGLDAPLMGSGMAFTADTFDWLVGGDGADARCVVEDCAWSARLALAGVPVAFAPNAIVDDEKTKSADAMRTQRARWVVGRSQVARAYAGRLLRRGLLDADPVMLDVAGQLVAPPRVLLLVGVGACGLLAATHAPVPGVLPLACWVAIAAALALYLSAPFWVDGPRPKEARVLLSGLWHLPRFGVQMVASTCRALRGAPVAWVPTPHGEAKRP